MAATLAQLVTVRSQLAEAVLDYLAQLANELDQTQWHRGGERLKASAIAVEQFVLTMRKRERPARPEHDRANTLVEKRSPLEEIEAQRYELPVNADEREEVRWRQVLQRGRMRIGLKGAPGSGKTFTTQQTMAAFVLAEAAKLAARQMDVDEVEAPLWVTAKALAETGSADIEDALPATLENSLNLKLSPLVRNWLQRAIRSSRFLIVVDALDELLSTDHVAFQTQAQRLDKLHGRVIVTCRTMHWEERRDWLGWNKRIEEVELAPFKPRQQREFARKFLGNTPDLAQGMERLLQVNFALRHACTTPLLLTFACLLHEVGSVKPDTSYAQLYAEITRKLMSGEWRSLKAAKPVWVGNRVKEERCFHFLEAIAWGLFAQAPQLNRFTLGDWEQAAEEALPKNKRAPLDPAEFLEQLENAGFIVPAGVDEHRRDRCWSFVHRTLLEFLAASALSRQQQGVWLAEAKQHFWFQPEWLEVLTFLAGLVDDATPLIEAVAEEPDDLFGSMLYLKARFVGAARKGDEEVVRQVCAQMLICWKRTCNTYWEEFALTPFAPLTTNIMARDIVVESVLEMTRDEFLRSSAAKALARIGIGWAVEQLLDLIRYDYEDDDAHRAVVAALAQVESERAQERLLELTHEEYPYWMRRAAVKALGEIGDGRAVERLLELTREDDSFWEGELHEVAAEALGQIGDERAVERLLELTQGEYPTWVRASAAKALGWIGDNRAVEHLLEYTWDVDQEVRTAAAEALVQIRAEQAVERLVNLTKAEDGFARMTAAEALGNIGDERAADKLLELTRDADLEVRMAAAKALGQIGAKQATERLIELTQFGWYLGDWEAAVEALGSIGANQALDRLLDLTDADYMVSTREKAIKALGRIGGEQVVGRLLELTGSTEWYVREDAAEALGQLGSEAAVPHLLAMTDDKEDNVRYTAAKALGLIGSKAAVARLLAMTHDRCWYVPEAVARALWQISWKHRLPIRMPDTS